MACVCFVLGNIEAKGFTASAVLTRPVVAPKDREELKRVRTPAVLTAEALGWVGSGGPWQAMFNEVVYTT